MTGKNLGSDNEKNEKNMINFIRKFADSLKFHDPVGMRLNPITLSFLDKEMEEAFLEDYFNKYLKQIKISTYIGISLWICFGILDMIIFPQIKKNLWIIRVIILPFIFSIIPYASSSYFRKYMQLYISFIIVMAGCGIIAMIAIAPPPDNFGYYTGLILVFIFGYTFIRVRFIWAIFVGWIIIILYEITAILIKTPIIILSNNSFIFIAANIMGMYACYLIEYYTRKDFFISYKLIKANQQEKQRTHELTLLNKMSDLLNQCRTEKATYDVIADTSRQLFPDDSGYMMVINNPGTQLEKVFSWGNSSNETQFVDFDSCSCFQNGKIQSSENYICIPIIIERDKTWGIFHLNFPKHDKPGYSDEEYKRIIESKSALAVRMTDQYGLFLTNLRLRIIDPLTGLYNRIYIRESLEKEISHFSYCGMMMTDFDDFRNFNQAHGSDAGDMLLQKFTGLLKKNIRNQDIICRYGDDEFILIMPELSLSEIGKRAEQLRSEIAEKFSMNYNEKNLNITASFGVVGFPEHGSTINDVLNAASKALNRAKAGGKNRIVVL